MQASFSTVDNGVPIILVLVLVIVLDSVRDPILADLRRSWSSFRSQGSFEDEDEDEHHP